MFQTPKGSSHKISIVEEITTLISYMEQMDKNYQSYNSIVLASSAKECGQKYGHLDVSCTTAYLPGKIHSPAKVTNENNKDPYNELNIEIPKGVDDSLKQIPGEIDIAGLMVDRDFFEKQPDGSLSINLDKLRLDIKKIDNKLSFLDKNDLVNNDQIKKLTDKKWLLEAKLNVHKACEECNHHHIPVLCT